MFTQWKQLRWVRWWCQIVVIHMIKICIIGCSLIVKKSADKCIRCILLYITIIIALILCVSPAGTPVSDTVCERCPAGYFSTGGSSTERCQHHRNCSDLGLKTLRWGTSTSDSLCGTQDKTATVECSQHHNLCHTGENMHCTVQLCKTLLQ